MVSPFESKHENTRPAVMLLCSVTRHPLPSPARAFSDLGRHPCCRRCRTAGSSGILRSPFGVRSMMHLGTGYPPALEGIGGRGGVDVVLGLRGFVRAWYEHGLPLKYLRADSSHHARSTAVFSQTQLRRLKQRDLCAQLPVALFFKTAKKQYARTLWRWPSLWRLLAFLSLEPSRARSAPSRARHCRIRAYRCTLYAPCWPRS